MVLYDMLDILHITYFSLSALHKTMILSHFLRFYYIELCNTFVYDLTHLFCEVLLTKRLTYAVYQFLLNILYPIFTQPNIYMVYVDYDVYQCIYTQVGITK